MTVRWSEPAALAGVRRHVEAGGRLRLFLDYDGTLVPIAPTPDEARPDAVLLATLDGLARRASLQVVILSGRALSSLQAMLPVRGLILAGTYGLELQVNGRRLDRDAGASAIRPALEAAKSAWSELIGARPGFLIEDKGLAVALHARWAAPPDADWVLPRALAAVKDVQAATPVRILGGDRFLELAPELAHKGRAVEWLIANLPWPEAQLVYFGDDDKDEEAYAVVRQHGGIPIAVGPRQHRAGSLGWLPSPAAVRAWLSTLLPVAGD